jgi:hypothetical protein
MKKEIMIIVALFMIIPMFVSATLPAFADIGTDINSHWAFTKPTIDGTISPGEWSDAATRNFTLDMRSNSANTHAWYLKATLYVKNNYTNLYIAVRIYNDTYWAADTRNYWKGLGVYFNNNDNGTLGNGENGEIKTTWTGSPFYSKNDIYYNTSLGYWDPDTNSGGTNDGAIAFSHTNPTSGALGDWTFEMQIPLVGSDSRLDFHITKAQLPKTLGYKVEFEDEKNSVTGVYPDNASNPVDQTTNAATFGDLIIHPLYYLTIQTTPPAGGTTNPAPGQYPYGYGTIVNVLATPNPGYAFDHWVLDATPVGSANPYSVTMYSNHTLQAVFRPLVVGGMAAPIIIPAGEPNLLTSLIWLVSAIICPIALMVVFVKLKKKKF